MINKKNYSMGAMALCSLLILANAAPTWAAGGSGITADATGQAVWKEDSKASLTIRKYDIRSAQKDNVYEQGQIEATGQRDASLEEKLDGYSIEGVQFTYRRLGDIETCLRVKDRENSVEIVYEIPEDLASILGLSSSESVDMSAEEVAEPCDRANALHYSSQQLIDAMTNVLKTDNVQTKNRLESYVYDYEQGVPVNGAVNMEETDASGYTEAENLELGLYLVVETKVPEDVTSTVDPWLVSLPFTDSYDQSGTQWLYDMVCYPKNQTGGPTLDKSVRDTDSKDDTYGNTATVSAGDCLDYTIVSKLPCIASGATYLSRYDFKDTLSSGLTYRKDAKVAFYHDAENAAKNDLSSADELWDGSEGYYEVSYGESVDQEGYTQMLVKMTKKGLAQLNGEDEIGGSAYSEHYMVVYYSVDVHEDDLLVLGDEGNPNDVELMWSRTSDSFYDTLQDRNYVYTYGLNVKKKFSDKKGDFSKVKFVMFNDSDDTYVQAEKTKDGAYTFSGRCSKQEEATVLIPNLETGELTVKGLEADTYQLTEIATDDGYNLLKDSLEITYKPTERQIIAATLDSDMIVGDIQPAQAEVAGEKAEMTDHHASVVLTVTNSKDVPLPQTGGSGLYAVTILGVLTAAGGCLLMGRKKSKR